MSLQKTPNANRLHIGIFGKVNSGKSTLLNALTAQDVALVASQAGTTTDPVFKTMEIKGIGPVVFVDTAGFQDTSMLGSKRMERTKEVAKKVDIAIVLFGDEDVEEGLSWVMYFKEQNTKVLLVINTIKQIDYSDVTDKINRQTHQNTLLIDVLNKNDVKKVREELIKLASDEEEISITKDLVKQGDIVLLVMPQDIQAPKGRLILPQVQTTRELLDKKCVVISCTTDKIEQSLASLNTAPDLIICDSQVFKTVYEKKPKESKLTSFSILFAGYKGDINEFFKGAKAIASLTENSHVLIAEACTHAPLSEDIGRVKIPRLLKQRIGENITIDVVSGNDFPDDLSSYQLIIHCGACMFNRKYVLSRIKQANEQEIPITNYGITLAYLSGILDKVSM